MSTASMAKSLSISSRIALVQGSAPKIPTSSELSRGSSPWRRNSSRIDSM